MAQEIIKARAHQSSWSIQSYPGKVKLPSDILRPLPNPETANKVKPFVLVTKNATSMISHEVVKTVYLPDEALATLNETLKHGQKGTIAKVRFSP